MAKLGWEERLYSAPGDVLIKTMLVKSLVMADLSCIDQLEHTAPAILFTCPIKFLTNFYLFICLFVFLSCLFFLGV